jgi:hypothetical protein
MGKFVCRLLASHKWERVQTPSEETWRCRRCGKLHYGKLEEPSGILLTSSERRPTHPFGLRSPPVPPVEGCFRQLIRPTASRTR